MALSAGGWCLAPGRPSSLKGKQGYAIPSLASPSGTGTGRGGAQGTPLVVAKRKASSRRERRLGFREEANAWAREAKEAEERRAEAAAEAKRRRQEAAPDPPRDMEEARQRVWGAQEGVAERALSLRALKEELREAPDFDGSFKHSRRVQRALAALESAKLALAEARLELSLTLAGPSSKSGKARSLADYKWEYGGTAEANYGRYSYVLNTCISEGAWRAAAEVATAAAGVGLGDALPPKPLQALLAALEAAGGVGGGGEDDVAWAEEATEVIRGMLPREEG